MGKLTLGELGNLCDEFGEVVHELEAYLAIVQRLFNEVVMHLEIMRNKEEN